MPGKGELVPGVQTQLLTDHRVIQPQQTFEVVWHVQMAPGWHVYWQNPGDSGLPVTFDWQLPAGFQAGEARWPAPDVIRIDPFINYGFYNQLFLPVQMQAPAELKPGTTVQLRTIANFLYCKDVCLPAEIPLQTSVQVGTAPEINEDVRQYIQNQTWPTLADFTVTAQATPETLTLTFPPNMPHTGRYIPAQEGWIEDHAPQHWEDNHLIVQRDTWTDNLPSKLAGLWHIDADTAHTLTEIPVETTTAKADYNPETAPQVMAGSTTLGLALAFAFLAGLILNVMPCVLPVLSLKVMGLVAPGHRVKHTIAYTVGVLVMFWGLALTLSLLPVAQAGWGFHLQSPYVVGGLVALLSLMAFAFFGQLPLPAFLQQTEHKLGQRRDTLGAFGSGLLMTLVATPCTVPFMGSAVAFALGAPTYQLFLVMTALGLGLAAPFALLALWPRAHRWLPRSGPWNHVLKVMLGLPLIGTVIWLLFVLKTLLGLDVRLLLALILVLLFLSYIALRRALTDMPKARYMAYAGLIGILGVSLAVLPLSSSKPHATDADKWSPEKVGAALAQGRPVFVNATADWCITCKVVEHTVLRTDAFQTLLEETNTQYLVADWTQRDLAISRLLATFNHPGVPLYVIYRPDAKPVVLPQLPRVTDFKQALQ